MSSVLEMVRKLQSMSNEELIKELSKEEKSKHTEEELAAMHQILVGRQPYRPSSEKELTAAVEKPDQIKFRPMHRKSNAEVAVYGSKCEIRFPGNGVIVPERNEFDSWEDLFRYVIQVFGLPEQKEMRYSMKRTGKYERRNADGDRIYSFGDPILDLITDAEGWLIVGGERQNPRTMEQAASMSRSGGLLCVDLSAHLEEIRRAQIAEAMSKSEKFMLEEVRDDLVVLKSRNPSEVWFHSGSASMRFRAWRNNYKLYWTTGAEIETWGGNFIYAKIESDYGSHVGGQNVCAIMKRDWDSDRNDHYVDEWEWGVVSPLPTGVRSWCTAQWKNGYYRYQVQAGGCGLWL